MSTRFYQHILPGDDLGKVTRLKYIDDISDDELILYYFEDGSKCSSEFIADVEEENPIQAKKVMVTLAGSNYPWVFERKEVVDEKSPIMKADDGIMYEAPTPGTHLGGMGQNRTVEKFVQEGIRTEVRPPRRPAKYTLPPLEDFYLSLHPELEYGGKVVESTPENKKTQQKPNMSVLKKSNTVIEEDYTIDDFDAALSESEEQKKHISKKESVKETVEETVEIIEETPAEEVAEETPVVEEVAEEGEYSEEQVEEPSEEFTKLQGEYEQLKQSYAELEESYNQLSERFSEYESIVNAQADYSELKAFKEEYDRAKYESEVEEVAQMFGLKAEEVEELKSKALNKEITVEQFKEKLALKYAMNQLAKKPKVEDNSSEMSIIDEDEVELSNKPYGGYFEKYKNKK